MRDVLTTICELVGAATVAVGIGLIFMPAGLIAVGVALIGLGYLGAQP